MKRIALISLFLALSPAGVPQAHAARGHVEPGDLDVFSEARLAALTGAHHEAAIAMIRQGGAEARESEARNAVKAAKRALKVEEADAKAARAELKASEKNADADRIQEARLLNTRTKQELEVARSFLQWKKELVTLQKARVKLTRITTELRAAEVELARVELLMEHGDPAQFAYVLKDFVDPVAKGGKKLEASRRAVERAERKAAERESTWAALERASSSGRPNPEPVDPSRDR